MAHARGHFVAVGWMTLTTIVVISIWAGVARSVILAAGPDAVPPTPAPALTMAQVRAEATEYLRFLVSLTRAKTPDGPFVLNPSVKVLPKNKFSLADSDREHLGRLKEQAANSRFLSLLAPPRSDLVKQAFDRMLNVCDGPAGLNDPVLLEKEAKRQVEQWVRGLAQSLKEVKQVLVERQNRVGLIDPIPELSESIPSASSQESAKIVPQTSPSVGVSVGPSVATSSATTAVIPLDACSDAAQEVKLLRAETQKKLGPIRELISTGDRALFKRYFEESRDSYERAIEATDDLEKKWHKILVDMVGSVSTEERFQTTCTRVISESLSQAIAMNDTLKQVYPKLGQAYFELGKFEQAALQIRKSTVIDPTDARTWAALGEAEYKREEYDKAIVAFSRSTQLDSYQPETWVRLARAHAKKGEASQAIIFLRRAVSRGFIRFEELAEDPDLTALRGKPDFEELVFMAPNTPY